MCHNSHFQACCTIYPEDEGFRNLRSIMNSVYTVCLQQLILAVNCILLYYPETYLKDKLEDLDVNGIVILNGSWVRFVLVSVEFFIDIILPVALWPLG
jgi:hypothetical protein